MLTENGNIFERFWQKVDKAPGQGPEGDCWQWTGAITKTTGYGKFGIGDKKTMDAHRFVCVYIHELDMRGYDSCHSCDNRKCVRPEHLSKGTRKSNALECVSRDRHPRVGGHALGERNGAARLKRDQVREIKLRGKSENLSQIADDFGVSNDCIWDILNGRTWKHVS